MRTAVSALLLTAAFASAAFAVVDPCPNHMSFYFDETADTYEYSTTPYVILPIYLILTAPDFDAVMGYEFSYEMEGNAMITGMMFYGTGAEGPYDASDVPQNHIISVSSPLATSEATILATISVFVFDVNPIEFTLRGAEPNAIPGSVVPAVVLSGGAAKMIGVRAWNPVTQQPEVCAAFNGSVGAYEGTECDPSLATDSVTWDAIKSMYR